jgi:hypothetical protein
LLYAGKALVGLKVESRKSRVGFSLFRAMGGGSSPYNGFCFGQRHRRSGNFEHFQSLIGGDWRLSNGFRYEMFGRLVVIHPTKRRPIHATFAGAKGDMGSVLLNKFGYFHVFCLLSTVSVNQAASRYAHGPKHIHMYTIRILFPSQAQFLATRRNLDQREREREEIGKKRRSPQAFMVHGRRSLLTVKVYANKIYGL